jgi:hypothetical protein
MKKDIEDLCPSLIFYTFLYYFDLNGSFYIFLSNRLLLGDADLATGLVFFQLVISFVQGPGWIPTICPQGFTMLGDITSL